MAQSWSKYVNTDFYGLDGGFDENTESVEFKSGRKVYYLKNSTPKKTYAVNITVKDKGTKKTDGKTEFEHFLDWYENTIKSGAESFTLPDLTTGSGATEYRLTDTPAWIGQRYKEISLQIEEV